jgi:phosphotransferase system HPr (HPr) family protein
VPESSEVQIAMPSDVALHARPAGQFVKTAMQFRSQIQVAAGGKEADAKSILSVLALGAKGGARLTLTAKGDDAASALDALAACVADLTE